VTSRNVPNRDHAVQQTFSFICKTVWLRRQLSKPLFLLQPLVRCRTCGTVRDCSARAWWCGQCGCQNDAPTITRAATNARPTELR
jgi:hypothetical protein